MVGKRRNLQKHPNQFFRQAQRQTAFQETNLNDMDDPICPLCLRSIPANVAQSKHHLTPKLKGGKTGETVLLHHICHKEIHASLTEAELARDYHSIDALRQHPRIAKFINWIKNGPPISIRASQTNADKICHKSQN